MCVCYKYKKWSWIGAVDIKGILAAEHIDEVSERAEGIDFAAEDEVADIVHILVVGEAHLARNWPRVGVEVWKTILHFYLFKAFRRIDHSFDFLDQDWGVH